MNNIMKKLTSRKFLLAVTGVCIGLTTALGVDGSVIVEMTGLIGGLVAAAGSIIAYINGEAKVDAAAVKAGEDK